MKTFIYLPDSLSDYSYKIQRQYLYLLYTYTITKNSGISNENY